MNSQVSLKTLPEGSKASKRVMKLWLSTAHHAIHAYSVKRVFTIFAKISWIQKSSALFQSLSCCLHTLSIRTYFINQKICPLRKLHSLNLSHVLSILLNHSI